MSKTILIIGVRRNCYKAAIALGYKVVLWSDGELNKQRKKHLHGFIEDPYLNSKSQLSGLVRAELEKYKIEKVIANTEETVILGAQVREHLNLKRLAVNVTQRFHNKWIMKNCAKENMIPVTNYLLIDENTTADLLEQTLGLPLIIKPVDESGAQDIKIAKSNAEIAEYMANGLLAEAFVTGTEVSVETMVQDGKPVFHNITEYLHQWRKSAVPAQLNNDLKNAILTMNDKVISSFGVDRGMTHAEFYLTKEGPIFGEIAIRPPGGYYMELIEKVYGFNSWQAYVNLSCEVKPEEINIEPKGCAAVYIMHPGHGEITKISGIEDIKKNVQGIFDFSLRKNIGDSINAHENTSNEVGHILFWAPDRTQLDKDMAYIEEHLKFTLKN